MLGLVASSRPSSCILLDIVRCIPIGIRVGGVEAIVQEQLLVLEWFGGHQHQPLEGSPALGLRLLAIC